MSRPELTSVETAWRKRFAERLVSYRKKSDLSQEKLAQKIGLSRSFLKNIESANCATPNSFLLGLKRVSGPDFESIVGKEFLAELRAELEELSQSSSSSDLLTESIGYSNSALKKKLGPTGPSLGGELGPELPWDQFVQVPRWNVVASMGAGAEAYEPQIVETLAFKASFLRQLGIAPAHASIITGVGNSMEPTIFSDDLLIVNNAVRSYETKGVYVLADEDRLVAKRLERDRKTNDFLVISDNAAKYPAKRVSEANAASIHIMGRVRRAWSSRPL